MERRSSDWRTVLLIIGAGGGALLAFGGALATLAYALWGMVSPLSLVDGSRSSLDFLVLGSAFAVIGVVFVPSVYYAIRWLRGRDAPPAHPAVLKTWQGLVLALVWAAAAVGAGMLVDRPIIKWVTPLLYLVSIGIPVYFFVRLATGGLHIGSEERLWGTLAAGIELGITPAIVLELVLAFIALVGIGVYVGLNPDQLAAFEQLARQLQNTTDLQQLMDLITPWAASPLVFLGALLFFSILSPIIEEIAKSLAVWSLFDRLSSPAQGFAVGALSGAAFGMVESLLVSATPDASWTTTLLVRGASTMMHIMAASLAGWGIGQFRATHSFGRLAGLYLAAMTLHGLWNAAVVFIAFGSLRTATASSGRDALGILLMFGGAAVLFLLFLFIPVGMATLNWRFRRGAPATAAAPSPQPPAQGAGDIPWALEDTPTPTARDTAPHPPGDEGHPA
jgi:hypothetical protein